MLAFCDKTSAILRKNKPEDKISGFFELNQKHLWLSKI